MSRDPEVQLRFTYDSPSKGQRLRLSLHGLTVLVQPDDSDTQTTVGHLRAVGVDPTVDDIGLVRFPVASLRQLDALPERVVLVCNGDLRVLLTLVSGSRTGDPVLVTRDGPSVLNLSWCDATGECNEPLSTVAIPALVALGLPLVTDDDARVLLRGGEAIAPTVHARTNLDGFIELTTSVSQYVEDMHIPGTFRLDAGRIGVPASCVGHLSGVRGLVWDSVYPAPVATPPLAKAIPLDLSEAAEQSLRNVVARLSESRARAIVWPSGHGRRIVALAALESVRALPLQIVTMPYGLWVWHRHLELAGHRLSMNGSYPDVQVAVYGAGPPPAHAPAGLLMDDLDVALREYADTRTYLRSYDADLGGMRVACSQSLPDDPDALTEYFSYLRPVEFRTDVPYLLRYAAPATRRLTEHCALYTDATPPSPDESRRFRRSDVVAVEPDPVIQDTIASLPPVHHSASRARRERVELLLGWASVGTDSRVSTALARLVQQLIIHTKRSETVTVVVFSEGAAERIRRLVSKVLLARVDLQVGLPTNGRRSESDVVLVLGHPLNYDLLDDFIVQASDNRGPRHVTVYHTIGTIEDRLAVLAATMGEQARGHESVATLTGAAVDYLLDRCEGN